MQTSESIHPDKSGRQQTGRTEQSIGQITGYKKNGKSVVLFGEHANLALYFVNENIVRIKLFFTEQPDFATTVAVLPDTDAKVTLKVEDKDGRLLIKGPSLQAVINKSPFLLLIQNRAGEQLFTGGDITWDAKGAVTCQAAKRRESHFYGFGEKTSFLDKQGERYTMWNTDVYDPHVPEIEALYQSIPFLIHFEYDKPAYGLFLDNPGRTMFDMRTSADRYLFRTETGDLDFYIINGPSLKDIIGNYTGLTGRMPIPPKWAIGYHQSRYSYMNQEEVLELARTFRAKNIPCDVIYLDIHYMDEYRVFTFDKVRFPNPAAMLAELKEMGFRVVPIVDPGVKKDPKFRVYQEGVKADHFCTKLEGDLFFGDVWPGTSAFPDFTDEATANWWGELHRFYTDMGIRGIWNDMNEPAVFNETKTMDLDVVHKNNGNPKTHQELHNLYGMLMSMATYEGLKKQLAGERPFVLTRAGYAGVQRHSAVWTGDNRSFWEHMAMAMPMVLNLGLSGVAFAGPDIGGFAHHTTGQLLARWTQMGVFFPYCRNHSAIDTLRQEPWSFGDEVESICREYISLRYQLMPHMYSLFYEASQTGMPVMRPLLLEYPEDRFVYNLCDQFLFGPDMLIAPIYRPDTEYRTVYLPEGIWYDYWDGKVNKGGQHIMVHAPLEKLPIFVKAGAIIPVETQKQYADQVVSDTLQVIIYGGAAGKSTYRLYEDDGVTFEHENGAYNLMQIEFEEKKGQMVLAYNYQHQGFASVYKSHVYKIKHPSFIPQRAKDLQQVDLNQLNAVVEGWAYDTRNDELSVKLDPRTPSRRIIFKLV